ncbi:hypothetical protein [Pedobacter psychroterrae]|uniref:Prepilin-type N-terminal cleavage/methylation domain-containing protein n=1 Tax=Pedobacter psychroterrae TaxID=2530453 RepID=A0A4R0NGS1_9SPHI|nr:hypothetical protein [Pedobacter psychroterrae]TCC99769.1 hypothetical protein EZ437_16135 [Pedobacter psychroterrae]
MQVRIKDIKLKSATIVETIIALLILMISFSAGMVIYTKVLTTGVNNGQLRADAEARFLMDSLSTARNTEPARLVRQKSVFELSYVVDERFPGMLLMKMTGTDEKGQVLTRHLKWVSAYEAGED